MHTCFETGCNEPSRSLILVPIESAPIGP